MQYYECSKEEKEEIEKWEKKRDGIPTLDIFPLVLIFLWRKIKWELFRIDDGIK